MAKGLRLKQKYIQAIKDNPGLQGAIAQATGKSMNSVWRWCNDNAEQLIMLSVLLEIRKFLLLPDSVELTEEIELTEKEAA